MAEIINLNKKRKIKLRAEKERKASQNRVKFGRTKQEKELDKKQNDRVDKLLDLHRLEKDND